MKKISLVLFLITFSVFGQKSTPTCEILTKLNNLIQQEHYRPKPVDDSLSVFVFDAFINELDGNRSLFIKSEYEQLNKHRLLIDNYLLDEDCNFINEFASLYRHAQERKKGAFEKIQAENLDYNTNDSVRFSKKHFSFDLTENDFDKIWQKRVRYDILEDISKMSTNLDSLSTHFSNLEKIAKAKVLDTYICKTNNLLNNTKGIDYDLKNIFLSVFCSYFDPHTNYFSLDAKTSFMSHLSTNGLSLGLDVTLNEKEEIVVVDVVPSGPADKSKKIEKDDIILKVSNKKGEDYLVACSPLEKVGELIFSDSNKEIELTIQKKNGSILEILLQKQVMKALANTVSSFVVEKEIKIGYINIPNFYSDFDGLSSQGCADDVAKEISKLKKEGIQGLVINLQDNGGGSMEEAIKLSGMFIDYGPISILSDNKDKQTILNDYSRGVSYFGPMVILINGNSASASEFFAAAMQDYNRAIIVGSKSLGKATMQTMVPIDQNQQDFVKLTVEKFYRITGDSHQIKGVIPDINLPNLYDSIISREDSFKTALKHDKIKTKLKFTTFKVAIDKVIELSTTRTINNPLFNEILTVNNQLNQLFTSTKRTLRVSLKDIFKDVHEIDDLQQQIKKIITTENNCVVSNNSYDLKNISSDIFLQEINSSKIEEVKCNPYVEEAIAILNDFINFNK